MASVNWTMELHAIKVCKLIESLTPTSLEEVGTFTETSWVKKVNALVQIGKAVEKDSSNRFVEHLARKKKVTVLIHDAITVSLWKKHILPKLKEVAKLEKDEFGNNTLKISKSAITLVQEQHNYCDQLLLAAMKCPTVFNQLGQEVMDMIEYSLEAPRALLHSHNLNEALGLRQPLPQVFSSFVKGKRGKEQTKLCPPAVRGLTLVSKLVQYLPRLTKDAITKLLHPDTGLVTLLVDFIVTEPQPWTLSVTKGDEFRQMEENLEYFMEPNIILIHTLHDLFIVQAREVPKVLELNGQVMEKLAYFLKALKEDSCVIMGDKGELERLEVFLDQLCKRRPLVSTQLESVPPPSPAYVSILAELEEKKEALVSVQRVLEDFVAPTPEQTCARANRAIACLNSDLNANCFKCGKTDAGSQCSKCHYARYCDRNCQAGDWTKHKSPCARHYDQPRNA